MTDQELFETLKKVATEAKEREAEQLDDRWDALCHNQLTPEEEAALSEEARHSDTTAKTLEAFSPLESDFHDQILEKVQTSIKPIETAQENEAGSPNSTAFKTRDTISRVLAWWRNITTFQGIGILTGTAMAAAAMLVLIQPRSPLTPLPGYTIQLTGGDQLVRAKPLTTQIVPKLSSGSRLQMTLRPETAITGPIKAYPFVQAHSSLNRWAVVPHIASNGTVRLTATVGADLPSAPGIYKLFVVLTSATDAPTIEQLNRLIDQGNAATDPAWQLHRAKIEIIAE